MAADKQNLDPQYRVFYDTNGVPVPPPKVLEERAILEKRIAREQAEITHGFNNQPTAGHSRRR